MILKVKIFIILALLLVSNDYFSQIDSTRKQQIIFSFNMGMPLYNQFTYYSNNHDFITGADNQTQRTAYSKLRLLYNFNFEHNIRHFTVNFLCNYSQNEFNGAAYLIQGKQISGPRAPSYKKLEIYQTVKYNYLQAGFGLGYNHWIKKHNISITTNILQNIFDKIFVSSYFVKNSQYNDQDSSAVVLVKNYPVKDAENNFTNTPGIGMYANMKLTYSYALYKSLYLSASLNSSFGLLNTRSTKDPYLDNAYLGYVIQQQKILSFNVGIRLKLY